ncbi:hypothetical protein N0U25_08295, partial [Pseudomonas sivasensis]|nr:hypothetical protein [Pseudomonas sivasensis]
VSVNIGMAEPPLSGASPLPHKKLHRSGEILLLFAAITLRNAFLLRVLGRPVLEAPHQRLQVWPVRLNEGVVELAVS